MSKKTTGHLFLCGKIEIHHLKPRDFSAEQIYCTVSTFYDLFLENTAFTIKNNCRYISPKISCGGAFATFRLVTITPLDLYEIE